MVFDIILSVIIFFLGASVGSFLNVVVERTHQNLAFWRGRSFCPHCKHGLAWYDLFPLLSFLFLRAKCRYCKTKIAWQYFWVELATALIFLLQWFFWQEAGYLTVAFWLIMSVFFIIIFIYDLKYQLIYDRFSLPAIALALVWQFWQSGLVWWSILGGLAVGAGTYLLLYILSKGNDIGGGDIRLGALLGTLVGLENFLYLLLYSYLIAVLYLLFYFILKRKKVKYLPLGPFLLLGFSVILFGGEAAIDVIKDFFGQIVDFLI